MHGLGYEDIKGIHKNSMVSKGSKYVIYLYTTHIFSNHPNLYGIIYSILQKVYPL